MEMNEQQIQALMARVDARVDSKIESKLGDIENITPIAFEEKYMKGYNISWPIDQGLFRKFLHSISIGEIVGKGFKTIGGAVATTKEDTLTISTSGGLTKTTNGKTINLDTSLLKNEIIKLMSWNNSDANKEIVKNWMETYATGTAMENKYLGSIDSYQSLVLYWNAMLQLQSRDGEGTWVAWSDEHMCYIKPHIDISQIIPNYTKGAVVFVPFTQMVYIYAENYTGDLTVNAVSKIDMDMSLEEWIISIWSLSEVCAKLDQRVSALEGN